MIAKLFSRFRSVPEHDPERVKYDTWVKSFSARIFERTHSNEAVKAECECWPFVPEGSLYDWRNADPVDAADEALDYYED